MTHRVLGAGRKLKDLDCLITHEQPKVPPYRRAIREALTSVHGTEVYRVFVKDKTNECLDRVDESLAVTAQAICLISRDQPRP